MSLRNDLIRLAYYQPKLRKQLIPLIKLAESKSWEEIINEEEVVNPDTGRRVKLRSLRDAPKDSRAYQKYQEAKSSWETSEEEESDSSEDTSDESDTKEALPNEVTKAIAEAQGYLKGKKEKAFGVVKGAKKKLKEIALRFKTSEASFSEVAEITLNLLKDFFKGEKDGGKVIEEIMDGIGAKSEENFQEALAQLKAAEVQAALSPESKRTLKEVGIDPDNPSLNQEKIVEWLTSDEDEDKEIPEEQMMEIIEFFGEIREEHVQFLRLFMKDGEIDTTQLKVALKKGLPEELRG